MAGVTTGHFTHRESKGSYFVTAYSGPTQICGKAVKRGAGRWALYFFDGTPKQTHRSRKACGAALEAHLVEYHLGEG